MIITWSDLEERLSRVRKQKLADAVLEEVRNMIQRGELEEGSKLPNQVEFAAQLGVSRTSLREAINVLSQVGAVEQRPGFGTILVSKFNALNSEIVAPPLMSDSKAALELIEARRAVEITAAELAAKLASNQQVEELERIFADMVQALKSGDSQRYIELDMAFHCQVANSSNNRFINYFYLNMQGYIEQYIQECLQLLPNMQRTSLKFHGDITKAIRKRDSGASVAAMSEHLADIKISYMEYYKLSVSKGS